MGSGSFGFQKGFSGDPAAGYIFDVNGVIGFACPFGTRQATAFFPFADGLVGHAASGGNTLKAGNLDCRRN